MTPQAAMTQGAEKSRRTGDGMVPRASETTENNIILQIDGVTRWHRGGRTTVARQSLVVRRQERLLIHGRLENGITDIYRMIVGLDQPDEGVIRIGGRMAAVPKDFPYLHDMRVVDYMMLPLLARSRSGAEAMLAARSILKESDLWSKRAVRAQFLSGFERCLLLLLTAFSIKPDILIMGPCTGALNAEEENGFWKLAGRYIDKYRAAVLFITDTDRVPYDFDRYCELKDGILTGDEEQ